MPSDTSRASSVAVCLVAYVGERRPVAVGGHPVRPAGPDIGAGDGRKLQIVHKINLFQHVGKRDAQSAAPAGLTCLKEAAAGRPVASFSSFTSCQLLRASRKLMYPGRPFSTSIGQVARPHKNAGRRLIGVAAVFQRQSSSFAMETILSQDAV